MIPKDRVEIAATVRETAYGSELLGDPEVAMKGVKLYRCGSCRHWFYIELVDNVSVGLEVKWCPLCGERELEERRSERGSGSSREEHSTS